MKIIYHEPVMKSDLQEGLNVFVADGGPLFSWSRSTIFFMVKGRLWRRWVFVYYKNILKQSYYTELRKQMRQWILGNGPSINKTPLALLKDEITWGINLPPIKPTNYFCMDVAGNPDGWKDVIRKYMDCDRVYLCDEFSGFSGWNVEWISRCAKHAYSVWNFKRQESWHLPSICTAFGSMYPVLQLAVMNGATEIFLVGCDLFTGDGDHYLEEYPSMADWRKRNEVENYIHKVSKRSSPVPIINCTVGGQLEIYPRKTIQEVLNG